MNPLILIAKDRKNVNSYMPIRYIDTEIPFVMPGDLWKTNLMMLEHTHVFVVTNAPYTWVLENYIEFEGIMLPANEEISTSHHNESKLYRYFIGIQHFEDGSIVELQ
jgi:hypothetical protein